jgi:hypothetical protein
MQHNLPFSSGYRSSLNGQLRPFTGKQRLADYIEDSSLDTDRKQLTTMLTDILGILDAGVLWICGCKL